MKVIAVFPLPVNAYQMESLAFCLVSPFRNSDPTIQRTTHRDLLRYPEQSH